MKLFRTLKGSISANPRAVHDIITRREAGESLASIGKTYGVSRERIRQLCDRWDVKSGRPSNVQLAQQALKLLQDRTVFNLGDAAKHLKTNTAKLRRGAKREGIDLSKALEEARSHQHDGKRFGMWTVIPGSYRREPLGPSQMMTPLLDCRCDCGTERTVRLSNLLGAITRGCGCRSSAGGDVTRVVVPWGCLSDDLSRIVERMPNTASLAKRYGLSNLVIVRKLNRNERFNAPDGTTWTALKDEAIVHYPGVPPEPWTCLDTGETWPSANDLAKHLGISGSQLHKNKKEGRTYCAANRRHYTPVGQEGLTRSPFVPRRKSHAA